MQTVVVVRSHTTVESDSLLEGDKDKLTVCVSKVDIRELTDMGLTYS